MASQAPASPSPALGTEEAPPPSRLARFLDSDVLASFRRSKLAMAAFAVTVLFCGLALLAPVISPQNPYDPAQLELINANLPPIWAADGQAPFLIGTDDQGRDVLSAVFYGMRLSLLVGGLGVLLSGVIGIGLGLVAGYAGGWVDTLIMRVADVQLTFPAILIALIVDGVAKAALGGHMEAETQIALIVVAIGLSFWVQYARTVRGSVMVEKNKDYVQAGRLIGLSAPVILARHILPNVTGPVFVIATINLALAIITEATLSFLGTGLPETMPSLGTLIRTGNRFLFSGEWWIVAFPGLALAGLVLAINLLGDWLRDALNPKLQ
jgi:peptide/nickel transport system permease protein